MQVRELNAGVVYAANTASITSVAATVAGWLPPLIAFLASVATLAWMVMQIIINWDKFVAAFGRLFGKR